jgi:hypothetical protein
VIELTVEAVVRRGNGGRGGSEEELFEDPSDWGLWEEVAWPGM